MLRQLLNQRSRDIGKPGASRSGRCCWKLVEVRADGVLPFSLLTRC